MDCKICENLMDDYFDRHLTRKKRKQISRHLKLCQQCSSAYREYETILGSIHNLEIKQCPDEIVDSVYGILNITETPKHRKSIFDLIGEFMYLHTRQLGLAGAAVVVFFFVILIHSKINKPPQLQHQYSIEEVEQAKDQVKLALAYLNQITSRTGEIIEKQVLPEHVIKPMKSSIKAAIKPLINGG